MRPLSSLFPHYKLTRARAWFKNYLPDHLKVLEDGKEYVTEEGYRLCAADINREDPNRIQLEIVYARVAASCGVESANAFRDELLRMREREKVRLERASVTN